MREQMSVQNCSNANGLQIGTLAEKKNVFLQCACGLVMSYELGLTLCIV